MKQEGTTSHRLSLISQLIVAGSIFACIYQLTMYAAGSPEAFNYLERSEITNLFSDLRIWTHNAANCDIRPWELRGSNQCSDGPPFNYPWFPIALFKAIGINETHNTALGYLTGITTISTCFAYTAWKKRSSTPRERIWMDISFSIFILSRPMLYALERGQPDLLIFTGIIAICWVFERENAASNQALAKRMSIAVAALTVLTITKLYPLLGLLGCFLCSLAALENSEAGKETKIRRSVIISFALLFAGLGVVCLGPYLLTQEFNIHGLGNHGFGLQVQAGAHVTSQLLFKASIFIISCIGTSLLINQKNIQRSSNPIRNRALDGDLCAIVVTCTIVTGLYLFTENIYYKLIILYPLLLWSAKSLANPKRCHKRDYGLMIFCGILTIFIIQMLPYDPALQADKENLLHLLVYPAVFGGLASFPTLMALRQIRLALRLMFALRSDPNSV